MEKKNNNSSSSNQKNTEPKKKPICTVGSVLVENYIKLVIVEHREWLDVPNTNIQADTFYSMYFQRPYFNWHINEYFSLIATFFWGRGGGVNRDDNCE